MLARSGPAGLGLERCPAGRQFPRAKRRDVSPGLVPVCGREVAERPLLLRGTQAGGLLVEVADLDGAESEGVG